jgi:hypothetical protein
MAEDQEKAQSESETHAPQEDTQASDSSQPKDQVDIQREATEAQEQSEDDPDVPQDAPEGYEPQVELQPGQTGGIEERPGEQVSDVEEEESDQLESHAEENDDEAVDDPEPDAAG